MSNSESTKPLLGNRYQLQETIGIGGMAVVYLALDLSLDRQVAIKLLRQQYSRDKSFRKRFQMEAKAAANLSHQNIVTVYDFGLDSDRLFIVMEHVPGEDLKSILQQQDRLSLNDSLILISQACFGIGYAHRSGLVHCDVKPHNMLVTPSRSLKVTDFGIARLMATINPDEIHDIIWGSPLYFSPEQAAGEAPSPASDVYSLGVILYEALTGQMPFMSNDPQELVRLHRDAEPPLPRDINPEIPPSVERIILKVLSKKPTSRYRTADQLGRILLTLSQRYDDTPAFKKDTLFQSRDVDPVKLKPTTPAPSQSPPSENIQRAPPTPQAGTLRPAWVTAESASQNTSLKQNEQTSGLNIDWVTIGIALVAALAVGGLIPFWIYVWFTINRTGF